MSWVALELVGVSRADLDTVSEHLFALGASGLQEDHLPGEAPRVRQPWDSGPKPRPPSRILLRAWFEDPDKKTIEALVRGKAPELRWEEVEEVDWEAEWRASIRPLVISPRLVIAPPWDAPPGAVLLEPGQGFGSGEHPTTRQALVALDALADQVRTVLDVGCGSGILALAATRLGLRAWGVDVEESAVADAKANAAKNGFDVPFSTTPVARLTEPADLVLANLHAELIVALGADLVRLTGEWLVLAGILADREDKVRRVLDEALECVHREQDGEWVSLRYRRRA